MKKQIKVSFIGVFILMIMIFCFSSFNYKQRIINQTNYIPYYLEVHKADSLYKKGNFHKCFNILKKLFKKYEPLNQDLYYEYNIYIKSSIILNKNIDYKKSVSKLIHDFGYEKKIFEGKYKDSLLAKAYIKSNMSDVDFEVLRNKYAKAKNLTLRDTIIEMNKADQLYRHGEDYQKYTKQIDSIENINEKKLLYIFTKYGFPNENIIGNNYLRGKRERILIDAILIHMADRKNKDVFRNNLLNFVKKGKCSPSFYASFIDRECLNANKEQTYYTFEKKEVLTSEYIKRINYNRKQIGLYNYKQ